MARIFFCALLLFSLFGFARLSPQSQDVSGQSPTTPAQQNQTPRDPSPQDKAGANSRIQDSIEDLLKSDPVLSGADVQVAVDDKNITLTGTTQSYAQHQRVLHLVDQYSRWRQIVDKIH